MDKEETQRETLDSLLRRAQGSAIQGRPSETAFETIEVADVMQEGGPHRPHPELLKGIQLKVRAELGRTQMPLKEALQLAPGAVVDLAKLVDDPVDLYVGDLLMARGEVLVINDTFCIRITKVFSQGGGEEEA